MYNPQKIKKLFGITKTPQKNDNWEGMHYPIQDLARLGYHGLYQLHLHFSVQGIERWQKHRKVKFPKQCCVCNKPQEVLLPTYKKHKWYQVASPYLLDVPHCKEHGQHHEAKLITQPYYYYAFAYSQFWGLSKSREKYKDLEAPLTSIMLVGTNRSFFEELLTLNTEQDGDFYPPWIAFKGSTPYSWKQGIQEHWFYTGWWPFREKLSKQAYKDYFKRWNAPEDWIEHQEMLDAMERDRMER